MSESDCRPRKREAVNADLYSGGLPACLEAVLMSADSPLTTHDCAEFFGISDAFTQAALEDLQRSYEEGKHGFTLRCSVRGWAFVSARGYDPVVSAFLKRGDARLSQAALETLAIIAYKQPMTRAAVSAIRGVTSDGVVRSLINHGLVKESGEGDESRAATLVTTDLFLEKMGINALDQLAPLAPLLPSEEDAAQEVARMDSQSEESSSAQGIARSLDALATDVDADDGD